MATLVVGKDLISYFNEKDHAPFFNYGLKLDHKHLPEIKFHNDLELIQYLCHLWVDFIQGMIVSIPIHFNSFTSVIDTETIQAVMEEFYLKPNL